MAADNTGNWIRSGALDLESVNVNFYCTSSTMLNSAGGHENFV
jgi:hypothetical protein